MIGREAEIIMKLPKVKKLLGICGIVVCCGVILFVFEGYRRNKVENTLPQTVAVERDIDLTTNAVDAQTEREIVVFYAQCATEGDTLKVKGDEQASYTVKDYVASNYLAYMQSLGYEYTYDAENGAVYVGDRLVSDNVEKIEDENGKVMLYVKDYKQQNSIPVVKYLRVSDHEVKPVYIGLAPLDSGMVSGITFVMTPKANAETFELQSLEGVYGESLDTLRVYEGEFKGWALDMESEPVFDAGDEIMISDNMELIPYFKDNEASLVATKTGEAPDGVTETIDGKTVVRAIKNKGNGYALSGVDANKDTILNAMGSAISKDTVQAQQDGKSLANVGSTEGKDDTTTSTESKQDGKSEGKQQTGKTDGKQQQGKTDTTQQQQQVVPQPTPLPQPQEDVVSNSDDWDTAGLAALGITVGPEITTEDLLAGDGLSGWQAE